LSDMAKLHHKNGSRVMIGKVKREVFPPIALSTESVVVVLLPHNFEILPG
jgi:hypothetical protein